MPIAPCTEHLRINSPTVIPNQNTKIARRIVNLNLNPGRALVAKCIHEGFPANPVHFVTDHGMQRSWLTFHDHPKINFLRGSKFLRNPGKRLSEIV